MSRTPTRKDLIAVLKRQFCRIARLSAEYQRVGRRHLCLPEVIDLSTALQGSRKQVLHPDIPMGRKDGILGVTMEVTGRCQGGEEKGLGSRIRRAFK